MLRGFVLLGLGILGYVGSSLLTARYLERSVPGILERSQRLGDGPDGRRLWELTAGTGIVPKWVSLLGLLGALSFLLGLVLVTWSLV